MHESLPSKFKLDEICEDNDASIVGNGWEAASAIIKVRALQHGASQHCGLIVVEFAYTAQVGVSLPEERPCCAGSVNRGANQTPLGRFGDRARLIFQRLGLLNTGTRGHGMSSCEINIFRPKQ